MGNIQETLTGAWEAEVTWLGQVTSFVVVLLFFLFMISFSLRLVSAMQVIYKALFRDVG